MPPQRSDSLRTQAVLISTAERLFAERGVEGVSLSEINRAAGQRNKSALHYHFGNREGLLLALLKKHRDDIDLERRKLIDGVTDLGSWPLHRLVDAMVRPLYKKLEDPDGGIHYVRIMAQLSSNPNHPASSWLFTNLPPAMMVIAPHMYSRVPDMPEVFRLRRAHLMNVTMFHALLSESYSDLAEAPPGSDWRELQINDLIDALCGLMTAPHSDRTEQLLDLPDIAEVAADDRAVRDSFSRSLA